MVRFLHLASSWAATLPLRSIPAESAAGSAADDHLSSSRCLHAIEKSGRPSRVVMIARRFSAAVDRDATSAAVRRSQARAKKSRTPLLRPCSIPGGSLPARRFSLAASADLAVDYLPNARRSSTCFLCNRPQGCGLYRAARPHIVSLRSRAARRVPSRTSHRPLKCREINGAGRYKAATARLEQHRPI